ncbi:hypothetical protein R3P38DRAFT_3227216 [Favolaschia claudopus]|uniref:Uncharacterized protein n=1 Tax=Favolaschia claudopus TaxID=2862362 RepID=A0AAV9ZTV5_9AGAR
MTLMLILTYPSTSFTPPAPAPGSLFYPAHLFLQRALDVHWPFDRVALSCARGEKIRSLSDATRIGFLRGTLGEPFRWGEQSATATLAIPACYDVESRLRLQTHVPPRVVFPFGERPHSRRVDMPHAYTSTQARRTILSSHGKDVETRFVDSATGPLHPSPNALLSCHVQDRRQGHPRLSLPLPLWVCDHENGGILRCAIADVELDMLFAGSPCLHIFKAFKHQHLPGARAAVVRYTDDTVAALPCPAVCSAALSVGLNIQLSSTTVSQLACARPRRAERSPSTTTRIVIYAIIRR